MIIQTLKSLDWDLDYGELKDDADFVGKCDNVAGQLAGVQKILDKLLPLKAHYDELPLNHKIELDLLLVYMLNSLHWIDLRFQGIDVTKHPIKREFDRIKAAMLRWKEVKERDQRPKVNVEAAKRFVRSGLYDPAQPPNKITKFE